MVFPATILDLRAELLPGSLGWTDISTYVFQGRQAAGAVISRGRPDESVTANPSSLSLVIANADGRFSSKNPAGPYYGNLVRNTQVRVSVPEGASYLRCALDQSGLSSAPDSAGLSVTGDTEIQLDVTLDNWRATQILASKWTPSGNQRSWLLYLFEDGTLVFVWSADGAALSGIAISTAQLPVPFLRRLAIRVTLATTPGTVTFYTFPSGINQAGSLLALPAWTPFGSAVTVGGHTVFDSTAPVRLGGQGGTTGGTSDVTGSTAIYGKIHAFKLLSGIAGTTKASPDFTVQAAGIASFADAQSNTWTNSGTAEISDRKYRFHGETAAWPQAWDPTGTDVYTTVTASGLLRRLNQNSRSLQSAIRRYWTRLSPGPAAYWPCEEGLRASQIASGLPDGQPLSVVSGRPAMKSNTDFACSAALPVLNNSCWTGPVPYYSGTDAVLTLLVSIPAAGDTTLAVLAGMRIAGGTCGRVYVLYSTATGGTIQMIAEDRDGTIIGTTGSITGVNGTPVLLRMAVRASGADIIITQTILPPGGSVTTASATITTASAGRASGVFSGLPEGAVNLAGTAIGHLAVEGTWSDLTGFAVVPSVVAAWAGETAGNRFQRLCGEEGIPFVSRGRLSATVPMGTQTQQPLNALLQECADADRGVIFEPRQQFALGYRTRGSLQNQAAAAALTYSRSGGAHLAGSLTPTEDDQTIANDVTVSRTGGGSARKALFSGPLSTLSPPPGAGPYLVGYTLNVGWDSLCRQEAGWLLHMGTINEPRYPLIQVDLSRTAVTGLFYDLQDVDLGDRITAAATPGWLPPDGIDQLIAACTERLGGYFYQIDWTGVPATPYATGLIGSSFRLDTDGSTLQSNINTVVTSLSAVSPGALWTTAAGDFPFDIVIAGERMTVTNITGASSPQTFTVTRSVNGVVKAQTSGAAIALFRPSYVTLS
jgi:hypothetical protein